MLDQQGKAAESVNCRIGSLERVTAVTEDDSGVNCRIGSLEINNKLLDICCVVNCRIGSLEIFRSYV